MCECKEAWSRSGENQRISMRTDLEVLISFDLIKTTSIMQSADESVSECECKQAMSRSCIERAVLRDRQTGTDLHINLSVVELGKRTRAFNFVQSILWLVHMLGP